jgi:hypothetical protein
MREGGHAGTIVAIKVAPTGATSPKKLLAHYF